MIISVTGASGHIGANLCRRLTQDGHRVRALIHHSTKSLEGLPLERIEGDLMDCGSLSRLVEGADVVFHLAAVISIQRKKDREVLDHNIKGTRHIIEAAMKGSVSRLIHFSSIHALMHPPYDRPLDEERPLATDDWMVYSRSKALAEQKVLEAVGDGLDAVILNPTAVIGPFDFAPSLLGQALIRLAQRKLPMLVRGGYDWVDVRDVVDGALSAMERGRTGERYLLSGRWADLREIARTISDLAQCRPKRLTSPMWLARLGLPLIRLHSRISRMDPLYTADSLGALQAAHAHVSSQKAEETWGYTCRPLSDTLRDTLRWFMEFGYLDTCEIKE